MRLRLKAASRQAENPAVFLLCACLVLGACGKTGETPVLPPLSSPLSRRQIGFGVINVSYTHVNEEPRDSSASQGYVRRGSLVNIVERRTVKNGESSESWVLAEDVSAGAGLRGWLREGLVDIYDNEGQAKTASESLRR